MTRIIYSSYRKLLKRTLIIVAVMTTIIVCSGIVEVVEAVIGRPLTPMSYAGVARRTTRRTVYYQSY